MRIFYQYKKFNESPARDSSEFSDEETFVRFDVELGSRSILA